MGAQLLGPALRDGVVQARNGEPTSNPYPFSNSGGEAHILDPAVMTAGVMSVGTDASTGLYGFFQDPSVRIGSAQIPQLPFELDTLGRKMLNVYVADANNFYIGRIKSSVATAASIVGATCDLAPALVSPAPTITNIGTAATTSYSYRVTATNLRGESKEIAATTTTTGAATLNGTNYNRLTIPLVAGAITFRVYRADLLIAEVQASTTTTTVVNDTGLVAGTDAPATINGTGWVVDPTASSTDVVVITALDSRDPLGTLGGRVEFQITHAASQFLL